MSDDTIDLTGQVRNPATALVGTGTTQSLSLDSHGALLTSDAHGRWFAANYRGKVFSANVTAVTIPVVASGLVSVFTLYNPPSSGVIGEIISTEIGQVLATTVVDAVGWYFSTAALTALGTFTTLGTPQSGRVGDSTANAIKFYSAYTHSGTPVRIDIIGSFGATTDAGLALPQKVYNGRLLLPPGIAMSVAMSTAAGTASGLDVGAGWAEWPLQS
jgi:hypothetical protein